jgi:hypothetical protein
VANFNSDKQRENVTRNTGGGAVDAHYRVNNGILTTDKWGFMTIEIRQKCSALDDRILQKTALPIAFPIAASCSRRSARDSK